MCKEKRRENGEKSRIICNYRIIERFKKMLRNPTHLQFWVLLKIGSESALAFFCEPIQRPYQLKDAADKPRDWLFRQVRRAGGLERYCPRPARFQPAGPRHGRR